MESESVHSDRPDLSQFVQCLSFRLAQPNRRRGKVSRAVITLLLRAGFPLDAWNTRLPFQTIDARRRLSDAVRGTADAPFAVAAVIHHASTQLDPAHRFVAMDDRHEVADGPIALCAISGEKPHLVGSQLASIEPLLAENAYLLVRNANDARVHAACLDFVNVSGNQFRVLVDKRTGLNDRLTWGDGLVILQLLGRNVSSTIQATDARQRHHQAAERRWMSPALTSDLRPAA